jgi:exodeoxyribonuclease VII small subunit
MPSKPAPPKSADQTFESALGRLEQIVDDMEGDRMPLDQLLERYSEGTELLKICQEKLDAAEKKIEIITRNAAGKPQLSPFDPAAPAAIPAPAAPAPVRKAAAESAADVSLF